MTTEFVQIPSIPTHEVNRKGVVRRSESKQKIPLRTKHHTDNSFSIYINYKANGKSRTKTLNVILVEVFGEGAARAIGLKEPRIRRPKRRKENIAEPVVPVQMRSCTSCGQPTTDYRCSKCWAKIRGEAA